jgi:hypothetical protein
VGNEIHAGSGRMTARGESAALSVSVPSSAPLNRNGSIGVEPPRLGKFRLDFDRTSAAHCPGRRGGLVRRTWGHLPKTYLCLGRARRRLGISTRSTSQDCRQPAAVYGSKAAPRHRKTPEHGSQRRRQFGDRRTPLRPRRPEKAKVIVTLA